MLRATWTRFVVTLYCLSFKRACRLCATDRANVQSCSGAQAGADNSLWITPGNPQSRSFSQCEVVRYKTDLTIFYVRWAPPLDAKGVVFVAITPPRH